MMPMVYMASALAVEEGVMLRMGKFQLQNVVQSFQISCWLTRKE